MSDLQIYILALFLTGASAAAVSFMTMRLNAGNIGDWEGLARNKWLGAALGFVCLLWCIPHARPIVWDWMLPWLFPMAVAFALVGYFFLDYLFSRAVGGLFILLTYYLLHESFTFHTPAGPFFAVLCWIMGITGLFFSGKPHLFRDLMRKIAALRRYRLLASAYFAVFALFCLTAGILHAVS